MYQSDEQKAKEYLNGLGDGVGFSVLWSGGKDSTAVLLWVLENVGHDNWDVVFTEVTGNTHRLNVEYVEQAARELGVANKLKVTRREDADFFEMLVKNGIPTLGRRRWCLYQFKEVVWRREARPVQVLGLRRSDSARRRGIGLIQYMKLTRSIAVNPIADWSGDQVLAKMKEWGLELNPCYSLYGHSGNCMFCPYHSKSKIIRTLSDPEWGPKIISALRQIRNRDPRTIGGKRLLLWLRYAGQRQLI